MRLFFAVALDEAARGAARSACDRLQRQLASGGAPRGVKWVEEENLHVTVRFLGEVDAARVAMMVEHMRSPLAEPRYDIVLGGAGTFPVSGPPRVAWLGLSTGVAETRRVYTQLDARLGPLGFERETRPYTPHVTLGRVRELSRSASRSLREALAALPAEIATQQVTGLTLFSSRLSPKGPRYEVVAETPLS